MKIISLVIQNYSSHPLQIVIKKYIRLPKNKCKYSSRRCDAVPVKNSERSIKSFSSYHPEINPAERDKNKNKRISVKCLLKLII